MKNRFLLKSLQWSKNSLVEFHLLKLPRFFSEESIFTVFPDCQKFVEEKAKEGECCNIYLLCTFQPLDGEVVPVSEADSENEKKALEKCLQASKVSALISVSPTSSEWKDKSRVIFFNFLDDVCAVLKNTFSQSEYSPTSRDTATSGALTHSDPYFIDATDPASGIPLASHRGSTTFVDFDTIERFFTFESVIVPTVSGGCRMIYHPKYGLNVYPSCIAIAVPQIKEDTMLSALQCLSTAQSHEST